MKRDTCNKLLSLAVCFLWLLPTLLISQPAEIQYHMDDYLWNSGKFSGAAQTRIATTRKIEIPDAGWLRLFFYDAELGDRSFITITSLEDGATQNLNSATLAQWQNTSAYFNGAAVEIKLHVGPLEQGIFIQMDQVMVGEGDNSIPTPLSQCGPTDDRVPSNNPATGRLLNIGCTGWIIDNGLQVTAGHCSGSSANVLEFNVPPSNPNGSLNHPGPEDQYSVDPNSKVFVNGGIGNDWGVFSVFDNTQTGLQPIEKQGASFTVVQDLTPPNIRITGYGVDSNDPTRNQTQQTHVGPNAGSSGTTMRYQTDTEGGNSGSPVIDDATGNAVGVHTHGGCTTSGTGNNSGTSTFNTAFWNALNPPQLNVDITLTPINPPIQIPAGGGSFSYDVQVTNNGSSPATFDLWNLITVPNGNNVGPTVGPATVTFNAAQSVTKTLTQQIPAGAPSGSYTFSFNVGTYPGNVSSSDSFPFTKSSGPAVAKVTSVDEGWITLDAEKGLPINPNNWDEVLTLANTEAIPEAFVLEQNYPNPFNPSTVIRYGLKQDSQVKLTVYNILGQEIATLVDELQSAGHKSVVWDGKDNAGRLVSAGIYLYKIEAGDFVQINKMVFAK